MLVYPFTSIAFWLTVLGMSAWLAYALAIVPELGRKAPLPGNDELSVLDFILPRKKYYSKKGAAVAVILNAYVGLAMLYGYFHLVHEHPDYPTNYSAHILIIACSVWAVVFLRAVWAVYQIGRPIPPRMFYAMLGFVPWLYVSVAVMMAITL